MKFVDLLQNLMTQNKSLICVGLDPDISKLGGVDQFSFNKKIIDQTYDLVCAYKLNTAFYEADGAEGIKNLKDTCIYIKKLNREIPIILDAKRGDIGNTNEQYAKFAFDYLNADAITVHPYQGLDALAPFEKYEKKGIIVLAKTSNPESDELQNLVTESGRILYELVAELAYKKWQVSRQWMIVAGATHPKELADLRKIVKEMPILVPGVGAQGAQVEDILNSKSSSGLDMIINVSRAVIFADDPRAETEKIRKLTENYARPN